ncbi:hypothetical protein cypCar_00001355, partial [Cyprinus carpio]
IGQGLIKLSPDRWPRQMASSNGLCRYGTRIDCCWGWTRVSWGQCQPLYILTRRIFGMRCQPQDSDIWCKVILMIFSPTAVCQHGCKHGECVGPGKCKCHPGYTGKTCNQGIRTAQSKWFCIVLKVVEICDCMISAKSGICMFLSDARTCSMANCQYGCEVMKGEVRCQCPSPGLQLAPDGRTCVDVDECATGQAVCPRFRKCINTFGSYICKCHDGFDLQYINGKYQCTAIPKVVIDPPRPGKTTPGNNNKGGNKIPGSDQRRTTTTIRPPVTAKRISPTTTTTTITIPPPTKKITPPARVPATTTRRPLIPTRKPPVVVTTKPKVPSRQQPTTTTTKAPVVTVGVPFIPTRRPFTPFVTPVDNSIKDINQKQRGDVHIPRNHGQNNVLGIDLDVELGNTEEELKDDPETGHLSCSFDHGLCGWIQHREGDLHWETTADPLGGRYLTISEGGEKRGGRGAQLILPLTMPWNEGNLCLAFRHNMVGHHVGMLQVFVQKGRQHSPAVWGRTGGNGWRSTQITIWGNGLESVVVKGERRRGRKGEIALDDMSLKRGSCQEEHNLRRL